MSKDITDELIIREETSGYSFEKSKRDREEDIKILEDYIELIKKGYCEDCNELCNIYGTPTYPAKKISEATEYLIKAYKELEEERQIVGMPVRNKRDGRIGIVLHQWKSGSVAVLESINPRVINTHDSWNTLEIVTDEVKQTQTKCETIPVSLVEEKIEELDIKITYIESQYTNGGQNCNSNYLSALYQKQVLQELLEKR